MPKTLRVYAGSDLEYRYGETQYILKHLRKAVCWVASTQYNIHAFTEMCILDELAERAMWFLFDLARQVGIVVGLAGRRQANFVDILNGVYIKDRKLYREFLDSGNVEFCPPQESDNEALNAYVAVRLGKTLAAPVEADADTGEERPPTQPPSLTQLPPTWLELSMQRAILNLRQHLGGMTQSVPSVAMSDLINAPLFAVPSRPGAVSRLTDTLAHRTTRAELAAIENTVLAKYKNHIGRKEEAPTFGALRAGVLKRPAGLASEQTTMLSILTTDSVADSLPHKGLPLPWPSDLPDWAPLIPADAETTSARTAASAAEEDVASESAALQLELCDIEPDYPPIETFTAPSLASN
eukprot:Gregarina_sp_Pseudo_9__1141@NODE_1748_length_1355_cov_11_500000_g1621_i0_p1_GENE_NODE_1748_length_1355_cov_11_500000_g1621_i0NODE_1748_length_1355_cov_11_500000_g1621_i0_p1_ORF_typecomplete_len353_score72_56_NODE_1748_length_1355_cov_11_500000_g1621_i02741332